MVKELLPLLFIPLSLSLGAAPSIRPDYKSFLNYEVNERGNYTVTGVKASYLDSNEIRIYSYSDQIVDEIADDAFVGTSFSSIVISKEISHINNAVFTNAPSIFYIEYTGSIEQFRELNLSFDESHVYAYSVDEGFINYWNEVIRPDENINICNITNATFSYTYGLYISLIQSDLEIVNSYEDKAGAKIGDSMKELISIFAPDNSQKKTDEWNQSGAITLIIVIAVIGMTSITVFFLLKTKNLIG